MQLMCDAVSVLGAKHGLLVNPIAKKCGIIRFDKYDELPECEIKAGVIIQGKEVVLPLVKSGEAFSFHDQRMTPCTMSLMGIHAASQLKLKLTIMTPFRPKDKFFSTIPILHLRLELEQLPGGFRWEKRELYLEEAEFFLEISGPEISIEESGNDSLDLLFSSYERLKSGPVREHGIFYRFDRHEVPQRDRLVLLKGKKIGKRFTQKINLKVDKKGTIDLAWCSHNMNGILIKGKRCPFKYSRYFKNLDSVADWARQNPDAISENAAKVDGIIQRNNLSRSINRLTAYSLHSWLINTLWMDRDGQDFFCVWEGNCYFQSTVDVEYSEAPFYLAVWPELLKFELKIWPEFSKSGEMLLGERGKNTLFLSHDIGSLSEINGQDYPHEMEVEETTNYIILSYLYWRRTGDFSVIRENLSIIEKYISFLMACDSTGNGVPDLGVANTIDDGSPALQFGREQVYLAVKTVAAFEAAAEIFFFGKVPAKAKPLKKLADQIRSVIHKRGWLGDHFAVLLDKNGKGVTHPWTKKTYQYEILPGWDSENIFTENAIAMMDLVGKDLKIDPGKIKMDILQAVEKNSVEYGCRHSSYVGEIENWDINGFQFNAYDSSWISSNLIRDIAAFYRGIDLRYLADRYWEWQTTSNTQEVRLYFESFGGNNVAFYPRGVAVWGYFDALAGNVIDKVRGMDQSIGLIPQIRVPKLETADWKKGSCEMIETGKILPAKKKADKKSGKPKKRRKPNQKIRK